MLSRHEVPSSPWSMQDLKAVARATLAPHLVGCLPGQVRVRRAYTGAFMTSLDMAGFSLSLLLLRGDDVIAALDAPTQVPSNAAAC